MSGVSIKHVQFLLGTKNVTELWGMLVPSSSSSMRKVWASVLEGFFISECPKVELWSWQRRGSDLLNSVCELNCWVSSYTSLAHEDSCLMQKVELSESHDPKAHALFLNCVVWVPQFCLSVDC